MSRLRKDEATRDVWAYLWARLDEAFIGDIWPAQRLTHPEDVQAAQEAYAATLIRLARLSRDMG